MALANAIVFEVQAGGSDNNGGGFKTGATGTDFSQQTSAQAALTGLSTAGVTATVNSASAAATWVGNCIQFTSGTNFIVGVYEITSVVAGVSFTVDRNCTSGAGSSGVANMGGCFATPKKALELMTVTGMTTYIKSNGTTAYSSASTITIPAGIAPASGICLVIGYTTTRGDGAPTKPILRTSAAVAAITDAQGGFVYENLDIDGNSAGSTGCAFSSSTGSHLINCTVRRNTGWGVTQVTGPSTGYLCRITGNGSGGWQNNGTGGLLSDCHIDANTGPGIEVIGSRFVAYNNRIYGNTGASTDGIIINTAYSAGMNIIIHNSIRSNGRDGIRFAGTYVHGQISWNVLVSNAGYGINSAQSPVRNDSTIHHNAYYNNTSGARNNLNAGTGDLTLTADPWIDPANGDFRLNATVGAGGDLRSVSLTDARAFISYPDHGAVQSQQNIRSPR